MVACSQAAGLLRRTPPVPFRIHRSSMSLLVLGSPPSLVCVVLPTCEVRRLSPATGLRHTVALTGRAPSVLQEKQSFSSKTLAACEHSRNGDLGWRKSHGGRGSTANHRHGSASVGKHRPVANVVQMPPKTKTKAEGPPAADESKMVSVDDLFFDEMNPRLQGRGIGESQETILGILWREFAVDEVALSIAASGFFPYEPVFAANEVLAGHDGQSHLAVIEGNRRLAAVKLLRDAGLRRRVKATDLPDIAAGKRKALDEIPVIVTPRDEMWRFVGFKHVNGPQQWDAMAKAEYIAWVHNDLGVALPDIAKQIGDKHATVQRLYSALMALRQGEEAGVWDRERRYNKRFFFSHLYTGLGYTGIQSYLGLTSAKTLEAGKKNPIPKNRLDNFGNVCRWLFGDKESEVPPLVKSQNPYLRQLDDALQKEDGVVALERGLPLTVAMDIAKGDDRILRESLIEAKTLLQTAKARVVTGFDNDSSMLRNAEEVQLIAESIVEEMTSKMTTKARPGASRR
jgi:hypothetical protein